MREDYAFSGSNLNSLIRQRCCCACCFWTTKALVVSIPYCNTCSELANKPLTADVMPSLWELFPTNPSRQTIKADCNSKNQKIPKWKKERKILTKSLLNCTSYLYTRLTVCHNLLVAWSTNFSKELLKWRPTLAQSSIEDSCCDATLLNCLAICRNLENCRVRGVAWTRLYTVVSIFI